MKCVSSPVTTRALRAAARAAAALALIAQAGCGIGLSLGIGDGFDDMPPSVSIAANVTAGAPGEVVQLVAAASDDFGVDSVAFYRLEDDGSTTLLATDVTPPYQASATLPASPTGRAGFFARAFDIVGQRTDSELVEITLR